MMWTVLDAGRPLDSSRSTRNAAASSFLGPDLQETGRIDLPARIKEPGQPAVVGDQVLVADGKTDSLWRLDLATKRWKRIY